MRLTWTPLWVYGKVDDNEPTGAEFLRLTIRGYKTGFDLEGHRVRVEEIRQETGDVIEVHIEEEVRLIKGKGKELKRDMKEVGRSIRQRGVK